MKISSILFLLLTFCAFNAQAQKCDSALWKYVYKAKRLELLRECIVATGTIKKKIKELDGDWHILLQLDAGQDTLLNAKNLTLTKSCLVVEVICANWVIQPGVVRVYKACSDCKKKITIPKKGAHIKVTGSFVKDKWHGWNEIHPVSTIEIM